MKKLIIFLVIAIGAFAETVSVDLDFLLKSHPKTATVKKEIQNKKVALEKLAENIDSNKLESQIDSLMESVIDTFNAGFSKKEVTETINNTNTLLTENTVISSGDNQKIDNSSDELANLLAIAGIRK